MRNVFIISCGSAKQEGTHPASELYTGCLFRGCLHYARSQTRDSDIYILSAKFGLIALDEKIPCYDMKMGEPGSVTPEILKAQAQRMGIIGQPCTSLCGSSYEKRLQKAGITFQSPMSGLGLGMRQRWLKQHSPARGKKA